MNTHQEHRLTELLNDISNAMLVTRTTDGEIRARPMNIASVATDGTVWFATDCLSFKLVEIETDPRVCLTIQEGGKYISLTGRAVVNTSPGKVAELWSEPMRVWFPDGPDDPNITLVEVRVEEVEFWDNSGTNSIKYLVKAGLAYLSGDRPTNDETEHGKFAVR
jgi:general stress protein 26